MWSMLGQTLWITFFWYIYIFPIIFKIVAFFVKLSILNISTTWKGWRPVAQELAEAGLRKGIAQGKYPANPPEAVKANEMMKANLTILGGAIVNLYIVAFTFIFAF